MGAYLYMPSGTSTYGSRVYTAPSWTQLVTASSIPNYSIDLSSNNGVVEIVAAPSNTNVLYMLWQGFLYVSTNKGSTWIKTTQTTSTQANDGNSSGPWIAVDPNDPATAFIATGSGVVKTTNGTAGVPTFSAVASIGANAVIAYEIGSSTHILAARIGSSVVESINGSTFSATTGSHTSVKPQLHADKFGQFWLAEADGSTTNVFLYASSTWATKAAGCREETACVITDPASSAVGTNHVVAVNYHGELRESNDNGTNWSGSGSITFSADAHQPTWIGNAWQSTPSSLNGYSIAFDTSSNVWFAGGIGTWKTPAPIDVTSTPWAADTLGIEEFVTTKIMVPSGSGPLVTVWDRGIFLLKNPDTFPSNYWQNDNTNTKGVIVYGWGQDYASSDPTFIVAWITNANGTYSSASSTDGGNTWTVFPTTPTLGGATAGAIAALTSQKWLLVADTAAPIRFTTNGGTSWANSTISGTPTGWVGRGGPSPIAADRIAANTYCAVKVSGPTFYVSTDSGANFTSTPATVDGSAGAFHFKSVPGQSGHFWYTAGEQSGSAGAHPAATHLWKSTNTCTSFSNVSASLNEVVAFGFGSAPPTGGTGYPTVYAYGWLSNVLGFYQSVDGGTTWTACKLPSGDAFTKYPIDSSDFIQDVEGDPNVYGRIYVGFAQSGGAYTDTQDACPWVNFSNVNPNQALTGTTTISAAHSGLVPVLSVQFKVDGANVGSSQLGQSTYSTSWNASGVAPGAHTLSVLTTGFNGTASFSIPITTS